MQVSAIDYKNKETGACVILGNGPSLEEHIGKEFEPDIIGINKSGLPQFWPNQKYFVTVANDRLQDVNHGIIKAEEAVFSCLHKAQLVDYNIQQKIVWVDMAYADDYNIKAGHYNLFDPDLTKPTLKTFGGLFAIQVAIFLGYTEIYLVGFDGGTDNFSGVTRGDAIPASYHNNCLWHVAEWLVTPDRNLNKTIVYNSSPKSKIGWFVYKGVPNG